MRDLVKVIRDEKSVGKEFMSALSLHILACVAGFISARGVIFSALMPFGLAIIGGCSSVFLPSVALGAFIGYFIPAIGIGGFRYIAALLAVLSIRLVLSGYKKVNESPIFLGAVASAANLTTGIVAYSGVPLDIIKLAAECILIFGGVFIVWRSFYVLSRENIGFSSEELACLLGCVAILIIGVSSYNIFGLSISRTLSVFLILIAAKYGGVTAGSLCGIAVSFAVAATSSFDGNFGIYAFIGLASGIFATLGKAAQAASVIATGIIDVAFTELRVGAAAFLTEILIASFFFLILPRTVGITFGKLFYRRSRLENKSSVGHALNLRLNLASNALLDVSSTVTQVSEELGKINAPDFKSVLSFIEQDACAGCKLRIHCWESKGSATTEAIMQMINIIKGAATTNDKALDEFRGRCLRVKKMEDTVNNRYSQYASLIAAENRIDEVRQVVSEQFEGISNMLSELATDFCSSEQFDPAAAESAAAALGNIGINALECSAKIDKYGRMSLEMKIKYGDDIIINRLQLMKILSIACERDFDVPSVTQTNDSAILTVNERATYKIDIGAEQHAAIIGGVCGDSYKYFNDGKGHFVMVLSDGMGTGGRAAVDGAMASGLMSRLLKSGFGYACSLKILNSSMLFKSSDESLATMDIASIDLYTGAVELYKAGAAPTLVRRNGNAGRAESNSLPIGILKEVSFDRAGIRLRQGDILLLVSDGITSGGTDWIREELSSWGDGSAQDLAEHICDCARRRCIGTRADDMTVLAAIIEKSA